MINEIIILILITLLPFVELRLSIPLGILAGSVEFPFGITLQGFGMNWILVFLICVITNAILGPIVYLLLGKIIHLLTKIKFLDKLWNKYIEKTQHKIQKYVDKYGELGVALFIGVPLPGSGSYSGAIGSYVLGLNFKKFVKANTLGVIIAGILVTIGTLISSGIWNLLI